MTPAQKTAAVAAFAKIIAAFADIVDAFDADLRIRAAQAFRKLADVVDVGNPPPGP